MCALHQDDKQQPFGVILSIPLAPQAHNLDGDARYDISRSWSLSEAIRFERKTYHSLDIEVDVFNLGGVESYGIVNIVLHYYEKHSSTGISQRAWMVPEETYITIPAADTSAMGKATAIIRDIQLPFELSQLTHIYAVAFDPLFDPLPSTVIDLVSLATRLEENPARVTRHVACLSVGWLLKTKPSPFSVYTKTVNLPDGTQRRWWEVDNHSGSVVDVVPISFPPNLSDVNIYFTSRPSKKASIASAETKIDRILCSPVRISDLTNISISDDPTLKCKWFGNLNSIVADEYSGEANPQGSVSLVDLTYRVYNNKQGDFIGLAKLRVLPR